MAKNVTNIIKDIVESLGNEFSINTFCDDWLIEILYKDKRMLIYGYNFSNNTASTVKLCNDKAACSEFLFNYDIPCVAHCLITPQTNEKYIKELCNTLGYPIIVKDNNGTCGQDVFRVMNFERVMHNAKYLWKKNKTVSICAEENVDDEYRLIFYDGELLLCYKKIAPYVIGDGISTMGELIKEKNIKVDGKDIKFNVDYKKKLKRGVRQNLTWKRNLCLGNSPFIINKPDPIMIDISQRAIYNLDIKFCSVDILKLRNGHRKILEINGGVMMKYFAQCDSVNGYNIAFDIYKKAILKYFELI